MKKKENRQQRRTREARERRERNAADPNRKRANVPEMQLPELLYRAYGGSADWKNYKGDPMPAWLSLSPAIRRHWQAVAIECQNFARNSTIETIKGLVGRNVGDAVKAATDAAATGPLIEVVKP